MALTQVTLVRSSSSIDKFSRNFVNFVDVSKPDLIFSLCFRHQNKVNRDKFCGCFSPHASQVNVNILLRLSGEKNPIIYESVFPAAGPSSFLCCEAEDQLLYLKHPQFVLLNCPRIK